MEDGRLTHHPSEQWKEAYDIATKKLSKNEREWLEETRCAGDAVCSPIKMAEEARKEMVGKQRMPPRVRDKIERILTGLDKYARIVDIAIQHHPDITYVLYRLNFRSGL